MKLYDYPRSSSAWRVRIALALKGIDYESVEVDIGRDASEETRAAHEPVNPLRQVPVLEWRDGDRVRRIAQSVAIIEHLEDRWPDPPLLPVDPFERARARQLAEIINAGVQPLQNNAVLARLGAGGLDESEWARWAIERGLRTIERLLPETSGTFSIGDQPSVADVFLIPQVFNARKFAVPLAEMPNVTRVEAACLDLAGFRAAAPQRPQ